jgi:hypothetical protein
MVADDWLSLLELTGYLHPTAFCLGRAVRVGGIWGSTQRRSCLTAGNPRSPVCRTVGNGSSASRSRGSFDLEGSPWASCA